MFFFLGLIRDFTDGYKSIFQPRVEEDEDEGEITQQVQENSASYNWLAILKEVSDLTHLDYKQCWDLGIIEFFNYLTFAREYQRRQYEAQKQMMAKYKH